VFAKEGSFIIVVSIRNVAQLLSKLSARENVNQCVCRGRMQKNNANIAPLWFM